MDARQPLMGTFSATLGKSRKLPVGKAYGRREAGALGMATGFILRESGSKRCSNSGTGGVTLRWFVGIPTDAIAATTERSVQIGGRSKGVTRAPGSARRCAGMPRLSERSTRFRPCCASQGSDTPDSSGANEACSCSSPCCSGLDWLDRQSFHAYRHFRRHCDRRCRGRPRSNPDGSFIGEWLDLR